MYRMKVVHKAVKISVIAFLALFIVYFENYDQKLMSWLYVMVNRIFDEKPVDNRL